MTQALPDLSVDISLLEPLWEEIPELEDLTRKAVRATVRTAIMPPRLMEKKGEISVVFANDALVQVLNAEYRKKDKPTNVLTFASLESELPGEQEHDTVMVGDVILAYETIEREAREQEKFLRDHALHMLVHGILHLLGYDHQDDDEANVMETLEIRILEALNVQNPYTETISMA